MQLTATRGVLGHPGKLVGRKGLGGAMCACERPVIGVIRIDGAE